MKRKKKRGIPAEHAFKTLNNNTIKQEHRDQLGKFIAQQGMKIARSKHELTFGEVGAILKEIARNIKQLKESKSYGK